MARTALVAGLITLPGNTAVLNTAGQAIDQANGMSLAIVTTGIPAAPQIDHLILYVTNTWAGGVGVVTIRKGTNTTAAGSNSTFLSVDPFAPAFEAGKGDLVTGNLTASTGLAWIGPFEVARFTQPDGSINVDFSASMTGLIWAVMLARSF
jgi:hypothetical protein